MILEDFLTSYPRFRENKELAQTKLAFAEICCPSAKWGQYKDQAIELMTAHLITLDIEQEMSDASKGMAIAEGKPVSAAVVTGTKRAINDSLTATTSYGQQFLLLKQQITPIKTGISL